MARKQLLSDLPLDTIENPIEFVRTCLSRNWGDHGPGQVIEDHFSLPHLQARYPGELLSFQAPPDYTPDRTWPLVVLLHGGGNGTPRETAKLWLADNTQSGGYHFGTFELDHIEPTESQPSYCSARRWNWI
ncbi:MAG: hypothetical protein KAI66_09150 [Lentisphaeria bacterium]|nr:hypothetical protein [Lentisphaeria bacterium]